MDHLWSPWRLQYVTGSGAPPGCVFCTADASADASQASLVVHRGATCFIILNLFPYNNGHLMVVPYKQVADFSELTDDEMLDLMKLMRRCQAALTKVMKPDGFNIGVNLGKVAGAGIAEHLHIHVVPRWNGDTNFMPVLAQTTIMPQALQELAAQLRAALTL